MVLKACQKDNNSQSAESASSETNSAQTTVNGNINTNSVKSSAKKDMQTNGHVNNKVVSEEPRPSTSSEDFEPKRKRRRIKEKIQFDDLVTADAGGNVNLTLHKMEGYLHGPTPVTAMRYTSSEEVIKASESVSSEMQDWVPQLSQV